jgi:hypothetical protein
MLLRRRNDSTHPAFSIAAIIHDVAIVERRATMPLLIDVVLIGVRTG